MAQGRRPGVPSRPFRSALPLGGLFGQRVVWHNAYSITHTATGSGSDTGPIAPGRSSAPITFSSAGSFPYQCTIHPSMTGSLTVSP